MEGLRLRAGTWTELGDAASRVRDEVFVGEQGVPADLEHDGRDPDCLHVLAETASGEAVGTGRLLPDAHIGRLAVRAAWRGSGVGAAMLALLIEEAHARGHDKVLLNAQTAALGFYRNFGFVELGPHFIEAGEHQAMVLNLRP